MIETTLETNYFGSQNLIDVSDQFRNNLFW